MPRHHCRGVSSVGVPVSTVPGRAGRSRVSTGPAFARVHRQDALPCNVGRASASGAGLMHIMKAMKDYNARENGQRSPEEAISELQREVEVRRRLYDRWISEGRISRVDAHDRLERLLTGLRILCQPMASELTVVDPAEHTQKVLDHDAP